MWRVVVSCTDCVTVHVAVTKRWRNNVVLMQGSLDYPFWGDQTMQMYCNVPYFCLYKWIVWVGKKMAPVMAFDGQNPTAQLQGC